MKTAPRGEVPTAERARDQATLEPRTPALPKLLTVRELAQVLGIHEKTVYDWVAKGQLPCVRLGNRLRFLPSDVSRWLQARKEGV